MAGPAIQVVNASPSGILDFGPGQNVQPGASVHPVGPYFRVSAKNIGNSGLNVTALAITGPNAADFNYAPLAVLPVIVAPGATTDLGVITFLPTQLDGTAETATLTITSNAIAGQQTFALKGVSKDPTVLATLYSVNGSLAAGSSFVLDLGQVIAGSTLSFTIELINNDPNPDPAVTATATANVGAGFSITGPNPQSLNPQGPITKSWGVQLVVPAGSGTIDIPDSVTFALTGGVSFTFETFYEVAPFVPAFTLSGTVEATAIALNGTGVSVASMFNPAGTLNDGPVLLSRQYYVDQPHLNKVLNRLWLLFERTFAFNIACQVTTTNPKNMPATALSGVSNTATDGLLGIGVWDLQLTGSVLNVTWQMPPAVGQFSLLGFLFKLDEEGEVIENT